MTDLTYQNSLAVKAFEVLKTFKIVLLVMEMRTGKTNTSFNIVKEGGYKHCLFVTTKKAISSIKSDYSDGDYSFELTVINYASIHKVIGPFDVVIIDESHSLGAFPKPSLRTKEVKRVCKGLPIIYLSGTITPESLSQIYHQLWVSTYSPFKEINFYKWANTYVDKKIRIINSMSTNDYSRARAELIKPIINPLIIDFTQKEAGFKHEVEDKLVFVQMPDNIRKIYKAIEKDGVTYYNGYSISTNQAADVLNKLSQICGGTIIYDELEEGKIIDRSKVDFIKQNFKGKKIAIYYRYKAEFKLLSSEFNWTSDPMVFKEANNAVFLGQLTSHREGVDLSTADTMIVYNMDYSATTYFQVRQRMQKYDRDKPMVVHYLMFDNSIEIDIMKAVCKKKNFTLGYYKKMKNNEKRKQTTSRPTQSSNISLFDAAKLF